MRCYVEDLWEELDFNDLLSTLTGGSTHLKDRHCGTDVILTPLIGLLFLVSKRDPGSKVSGAVIGVRTYNQDRAFFS